MNGIFIKFNFNNDQIDDPILKYVGINNNGIQANESDDRSNRILSIDKLLWEF